MKNFLLPLTLALVVLTSVVLFATKNRTDQEQTMEQADIGQGEAQIGGSFTLLDQTGKQVSETDFRGKLMLVFFGFTHCPDICPVSVSTLSKVMENLGGSADDVKPIFITVDPARDTPEVMGNYLAPFDKRFIGLTGSEGEIKQVTQAYKAYSSRRDTPLAEQSHDEGHSHGGGHEHHGDKAPAADYMVDHSGFIYLMSKEGKFIRLFPYNAAAEDITRAVERALKP